MSSFSASLTGNAFLDLAVLILLSSVTAFLFARFSGLSLLARILLASFFLASFALVLAGLELLGYCLVCFLGLELTWEFLQGLQRKYLVSDRMLLVYYAAYLVAILVSMGSLSTAYLLFSPLATTTLPSSFPPVVDLDDALFHVLSGLSPYLFVLLLAMPILNKAIHRDRPHSGQLVQSDSPKVTDNRVGLLLLVAAIVISILGGLFPFLVGMDFSKPLGVDFQYYVDVIEAFEKQGFTLETLSMTSVFSQTGFYEFDRVLSNAFLILVYYVSHLPTAIAINSMPLLLGPMFVVSSYLLGSELFRRNLCSGICAYFAATSYTVTIGLFAGYYGNWQGNVVFMLLIWAVLRWQRIRGTRALAVAITLAVILLLTHTYTWLISMGMLLPLFVLEVNDHLIRRGRKVTRRQLLLAAVLAAVLVSLDYLRTALLGLPSLLAVGLVMLNRAGIGVANIVGLNRNLGTTFFTYAAGFSSNYLLLLPAVIGSYLTLGDSRLKWLFAPFITLSLFLFVSADAFTMQGRILYAFPIVPLTTFGFMVTMGSVRSVLGYGKSSNRVVALFVAFVAVEQLAYLLRAARILAEMRFLS